MNVFTFRRRSSLRSWVGGSARRLNVSKRPLAAEAGFESLEERMLLSASSSLLEHGLATTAVAAPPDTDCPVAVSSGSDAGGTTSAAAPFPLAQTFNLHSLPGANLVIYIDFTGNTTSGTPWNTSYNNNADIVSPAFDIDGNPLLFGSLEREYIQHVWQRVAEDFAPFNVDVTTEDPGSARLIKTDASDTQWGVRAVFTADDSWLQDDGIFAGGIAYLGSFSWDTDTPCFIFNGATGISLFDEAVGADSISHEVGHTLGLSHDGTFSQGYYGGHGFGPTSWAPIMGAGFADTPGYDREVSQWSQGEYPGANNFEDDLDIITNPAANGAGWGYSGLTYRTDDFGGTIATATPLSEGTSIWGPTFQGAGLIERNTDADMFSFNWTGGALSIQIDPFERGPNLDILAQVYDVNGILQAIANPSNSLAATINAFLTAGTYYLRVSGTGNPPSGGGDYGYSDYGSLGWYTISTPPPFEDRYEENDTWGQATDPLNNGGNWEGMWLSDINLPGRAQDDDWFKINVKPGQLRVRAELTFVDADGDLDLWLVDANGIPVAKSESVTDNEFIDFVVSAPGTYYLRVRPYANEIGNFYDLRWFDDVPISTVNVSVSPAGTTEDGTANIVFTFTRVLDIANALTVNFSVGGSAIFGDDYSVTGAKTFSGMSGSVTFAAGSATATVVIDPTADTKVELDENVTLTVLAGTGYELGSNTSATSSIRNEDQARVFINDVSVVEGNSGTTNLVFTLTLDKAVDSSFTVLYNTADRNPVSASSMSDYQSKSGGLMFNGAAGETQTITIAIVGDLNMEPDEIFDLVLAGIMSNGRNVIRDRNRAAGTIINDDAPPLAPSSVQASDNRSDLVAVTWGAVPGADSYNVLRSTVNDVMSAAAIATGIVGTSYDDMTATPGVTYYYWVAAVNTFGATTSGSDSGAVVPSVTIAVAPASILEDAAGTVVFTLTRTGDTTQALTVKVVVAGTATLGTDYSQVGVVETAMVRTVSFAAGSATATVTVSPTADTNYETDETVVVRVLSDAGYALGVKTAAATTITNDDLKPRLGLVTAPGVGFKPEVVVYDATGQTERFRFNAYTEAFTRGIQVATGDVNHDGVADIIVAPLSGIAPIKVFSGIDHAVLKSFLAFSDNFNADLNPAFRGGFSLAAGDVDGDEFADIIVAPLSGAGPFVRVFSGRTGQVLRTTQVLGNDAFKGGLNIAVGDTNKDGKVELFATPASAAGPFVRVYNPETSAFITSFWALPDDVTGRFTGGLTVAAGDVDGDGKADVITGIASQGGPVVRVFNPLTHALLNNFLAYDPADPQYSGGINVGVSDFNGDGKAEIVVASRTQRADVRIFNGLTGALNTSVPAPYPTFNGGVFATGEIAKPVAMPASIAGASSAGVKAALLSLSSPLDDVFADDRQLDALLTA
jgi:hypothetical protein